MDRKFVIALSSLAGSLMLSEAHAIGLGEIRLRSSLNEPLKADIKLVQVGDLSENEIIVNLAPKEDFDRAHVDRDFLLNSLRFRLDLDDPSNPKVVVTTQQPLREPFLNFLVEVQWPSGRLLREYTLLMDLPAFSESRGSAVRQTSVPAPGRAMPSDEGVSEVDEPKPVKAPKPRVATPKAKPAPVAEKEPIAEKPAVADGAASDDSTYGPTRTNDTMWRIAQGVRSAGSIHQKMLAIQRLNPGAFTNGNVNQLKKGQVLKLPSREEIASIGRADAIAQFEEQNNAWKSGRKPAQAVGAQLDATGRTQEPAPAVTQPDGQLKLAAPTTTTDTPAASATQGAGDKAAAEVAALQNDLSVGMEELNRAQRENQEIASRAKDLDAQKESAERLLQLQSNEMAAMQAKLAAEQQAKAAADVAAAQAAADAQTKAAADAAAAQAAADAQTKAAADAAAAQAAADAQTKAAADTAAAQAAVDAQTKAAADAAAQQASQAAAPAESVPVVDASSAAPVEVPPTEAPPATQETPAVVATEPKVAEPAVTEPVAAPKVVDETAPESSASNSMLSNPVIIGVVAVILILLGLFGYRRKANRSSGSFDGEQEELALDDAAIQYEVPETEEAETQTDTDWEVDESVLEQVETAVAETGEALQSESGDVLGEADIYISFGNFDKGEALLKSAIKSEPSRSDYRVKLLELYKESGNLSSFDDAYKGLIELDDDFAIARASELRSGIAGAADTPLAFGVSSAAAAAGISDEVDFDLDLDMDFDAQPETAADITLDTAPVIAEAAAEEESAFFDVDFDLDAEPEFSPSATSIREAVSLDTEELEITETVDATVVDTEEEFSLDFDLDLEAPALDVEPEAVVQEEVAAADTTEQYSPEESAMLGAVTADAGELDEDLGFLSDADESATKLDLARAYIDMGDKDGARDILAEVLEEGRAEQKREAQALLDSIG